MQSNRGRQTLDGNGIWHHAFTPLGQIIGGNRDEHSTMLVFVHVTLVTEHGCVLFVQLVDAAEYHVICII